MTKRYRSLNGYLKETFGTKVYKLALDCGMTCPNRDGTLGTKGCIFCSEGGSGDFAENAAEDMHGAIERAKRRVARKVKDGKYIAYFQSYTNTYGDIDYLERIFKSAANEKDIAALSIGTRPDCLGDGVMKLLSELNKMKPVFIELGLQTIHESTAKLIRRGYTLDVFDEAVKKLKKENINTVVHVILGLPGENAEMMLKTVDYVGRSGADGIKLQLLHVLKGTDLAKMYENGEFETMDMEEYISLLAKCISILPKHTVVHRLTGDAPKKLLVSPMWSADKKKVLNAINKEFERLDVIQGGAYEENKY